MKVIVVSDSHGRNNLLFELQEKYKDADAFIHCGDLEDDPRLFPGWVFVRGNNDYFGDFVNERIVYLDNGHKIFMTHSHRCTYAYRKDSLYQKALTNQCDIVCYGHTHVSDITWKDNVLLLNPGSLWLPRDGNPPSFAILETKGSKIDVKIIFEPDWFERETKSWWEKAQSLKNIGIK